MGWLRPVYSRAGAAVEDIVIELYDKAAARTAPGAGFDDVLKQPFMPDTNGDGIGDRVRPGTVVKVRGMASWMVDEGHVQDPIGFDPNSKLGVTCYLDDLEKAGLVLNGVFKIQVDDRLLRIEKNGKVRADFVHDDRKALFCYEVRHGGTGTNQVHILFESRQARSLT